MTKSYFTSQLRIEQIATRYDSNQSALGTLFSKLFAPLSNSGLALTLADAPLLFAEIATTETQGSREKSSVSQETYKLM